MNKHLKRFFILTVFILVVYGSGRLYFALTAGFTVGNIASNFDYHEEWKLSELSTTEEQDLKKILSQKFNYLGKGCQSYVFASADGDYVLKFVKFQRFRPKPWLDYLVSLPYMDQYRQSKINKMNKKLDMLFSSWKIAYENLKPETGLIFVHLNKTHNLNQFVTIYDKLGFQHQINLDDTVFLLQKRAKMLCSTINDLMKQGKISEAKQLLDHLLTTILSEYHRGLADNDHALMQNTGVFHGTPVHIDVGQFVINLEMQNPDICKLELFSKTFKFNKWLERHHPELATYFSQKLEDIIGPEMHSMIPKLRNPHAWSVEQE